MTAGGAMTPSAGAAEGVACGLLTLGAMAALNLWSAQGAAVLLLLVVCARLHTRAQLMGALHDADTARRDQEMASTEREVARLTELNAGLEEALVMTEQELAAVQHVQEPAYEELRQPAQPWHQELEQPAVDEMDASSTKAWVSQALARQGTRHRLGSREATCS